MPALGMAQETGILVKWLKAEDEVVAQGEPLMEIETDKVTVEIEAPTSGTLVNVIASPGDVVPVGQVIAMIVAPGETPPERPSFSNQPVPALSESPQPAPSSPAAAPSTAAGGLVVSPLAARIAVEHNVDPVQVKPQGGRVEKADVLAYLQREGNRIGGFQGGPDGADGQSHLTPASPKARRLAHERGLHLAAISGSGPGGAVLAADVLSFAPATAVATAAPTGNQTLALSNAWRVMAERLTQAWTSIPHFYLMRDVNASRLIAWRASAQERSGEKLTYTDLLIKLVAAALRQYPRVNAQWHEGAITLMGEVNVGMAMAVEEGLLVPVVHSADQLNLSQIAARRQELLTHTQSGKLRPEDLQGGTFTISNLGMYGVDVFSAVVNPPQAAILAVGRIAERVVAVNGQPAVQSMMMLSLSCDHRVIDGARAAEFLQALASFIEEPLTLLD